MTTKLMFSNLKGGVGKTSNSVLCAYQLAKRGKKVLLVDLDPQANATQLLLKTYKLQNNKDLIVPSTMMRAIQDKNISAAIVKIMKNLYLMASDTDFYHYPEFLIKKFRKSYPSNFKKCYETMISYFKKIVDPVEQKYDFVIYDVPPTIDMYVQSALMDTNYIMIIMQTQQRSLDGAVEFSNYVQKFINQYYPIANYDFLGILPVMLKKRAPSDNLIINKAKKIFGADSFFNITIHTMERLKRYDIQGISDKKYTKWNDMHDTRIQNIYNELTTQILNRLEGNK